MANGLQYYCVLQGSIASATVSREGSDGLNDWTLTGKITVTYDNH